MEKERKKLVLVQVKIKFTCVKLEEWKKNLLLQFQITNTHIVGKVRLDSAFSNENIWMQRENHRYLHSFMRDAATDSNNELLLLVR